MGVPVNEQNFRSAAHFASSVDLSILVERSLATLPLMDDIAAAVREINEAGRVVSLVSASERPFRENPASAPGNTPAQRLSFSARGNASSYSGNWRFDMGLRLAATDLLPGEKKRAVVFVGAGTVPEAGYGPAASLGVFEQYSLSELSAYMSNNNVVFYAVIVGGGTVGADIRYLCQETGGSYMHLYRNEGIIPEIKKLAEKPSGVYVLSYRSRLPTNFGRAFLPLDAEVYLMERSGRDSTGYFPPLE
jgi:hypothetical protein